MKLSKLQLLKSSLGFSLIEGILALGIGGMAIAAGSSFLVNQQKAMKALFQKADALELKSNLMEVLNDPAVCDWQLRDRVLDLSMATGNAMSSSTLSLTELRMGENSSSAVLVKAGEQLPQTVNGLKVERILFKNILSTGQTDQYRGTIEIHFDRSSMPQPFKPIQVNKNFRTVASDPVSSKRISACVTPGSTPSPSATPSSSAASCSSNSPNGGSPGNHGELRHSYLGPAENHCGHRLCQCSNGSWSCYDLNSECLSYGISGG